MSFARVGPVIVWLASLICLSALAVTAVLGPSSNDVHWHLRMGLDWLTQGLSPWVDHYSYTFNGQPIRNPPVVFEGILALAVKGFGTPLGISLVRLLGFFSTIIAAVILLRKQKTKNLLILLAVSAIAYLLQLRVYLRPEIFSYLFTVLAMAIYWRCGQKVEWRRGLTIALLMWLWSLYHSSVIGYVIFAGYFLECAIEQARNRDSLKVWQAWLGSGLLVLLVGYFNPGWSHPLVEGLFHDAGFKLRISENLPSWPFLRSIEAGPILLTFAAVVPLLAIRQKRFGYLLVSGVLLFTAFNMVRMITPAGIVLVLMLVHMVTEENRTSFELKPFPRTGILVVVSITVILASWLAFASVTQSFRQVILARQDRFNFPESLVDEFRRQEYKGRIFNDHGVGGYLLNGLSPGSQIYIDGRTNILYPVEHLNRWNEAVRQADVLREELSRYDVGYIILRYPRFHELVRTAGGFDLDFVDARYALYTRGEGRLRMLGFLQHQPACWDRAWQQELLAEYEYLRGVNPPYSALRPFADLVNGFIKATDGRDYFDSQINQDTWTDPMRRFAGYRLMESGEYAVAAILFGSVGEMNRVDHLSAAWAMAGQGRQDMVRIILERLLPTEPALFPAEESRILLALLQGLAKGGMSEGRLASWEAYLESEGDEGLFPAATVQGVGQPFCFLVNP